MRSRLITLARWVSLAVLSMGIGHTQPTSTGSFPSLRAYLVSVEGYHQTPYRDGKAYAVGVGHNLTAHRERVKPSYSRDEIEIMYERDLAVALRAAQRGVMGFDTLPRDAQCVVVGLIWTVGPRGFTGFARFRAALGQRDYRDAANELRTSLWWSQVGRTRARQAYETLSRL